MCAVCGRAVDEFIWFDEPADCLGARAFIARCHGKEERVTLTGQDFRAMAAGMTTIAFDEAFRAEVGSATALRVHNEIVEARFAAKVRMRWPYR